MTVAPGLGTLWDHAETVRAWTALDHGAGRYARANRELVEHAALGPAMHVLDLGAGTGGTTRACLARLGRHGQILCVEPAAAMRNEGMRRIDDPRVRWSDHLPPGGEGWDRILCGAAIWQLQPLDRTIRNLVRLLRPDGALVFTIPAAFLGEPDIPGGGSDPWFTGLLEPLAGAASGREGSAPGPSPDRWTDPTGPGSEPPGGAGTREPTGAAVPRTVDEIDTMLASAGFTVDEIDTILVSAGFTVGEHWRFRHRLSVREYAEWLRLPPVNEGLLRGVPVQDRAHLIERAGAGVDAASWRWERWVGWTAWTR